MVAVWPAASVLVLLLIDRVGAKVSMVAVTAGVVVKEFPAISITLAVKEWSPSARAAVVWACANFPGHVVVLATDNMAVFWAIKRGYTQVKGAQDDVQRINAALFEAGCDLEAVLVPGKWNVADQPSRGVDLCPENERHTRRMIQEALSGKSRVLCDWSRKLGESKEEKERKVWGYRGSVPWTITFAA